MPSTEEMAAEKERLYESSSLRDDLNDDEATVLLKWGESQVERLAEDFPDEFEQKARFLRQLIKGINRFVGQREFNEMDGQAKYMSEISMYLEPLGWDGIDSSHLFSVLPDDKTDMAGSLEAMLKVLSPHAESTSDEMPAPPTLGGGISEMSDVADDNREQLENPNQDSINQVGNNTVLGEHRNYGEEEEQ